MDDLSVKDFEISVMREKMLLHIFLSDIYQSFWLARNDTLEVLHSEIDNFGYDIVISANGKTRHIQLKSLTSGGSTSSFKINERLSKKEGGCVIIQEYSEKESKIEVKYHLFEAKNLENFKIAKHNKANAEGIKNERKGIKEVPKNKFQPCKSIQHLIQLLF